MKNKKYLNIIKMILEITIDIIGCVIAGVFVMNDSFEHELEVSYGLLFITILNLMLSKNRTGSILLLVFIILLQTAYFQLIPELWLRVLMGILGLIWVYQYQHSDRKVYK